MTPSNRHHGRSRADQDELRGILETFSGEGLEVVRVLKDSAWERTELVEESAHAADRHMAARSVLVRKTIHLVDGQKSAYEIVYDAQRRDRGPDRVPRIFDCRRLGNDLVVLMELMPGETLEQAVRREGGSEELAMRVFPSTCEAVQQLHELGGGPIIHRDIKPSNIMVDMQGDGAGEPCPSGISLIDLGIARAFRPDAPADTQRFGTPGYAPPEQFGYGQTSVASDVYALGMLLYYCLVGEEPTASLREGPIPFARAPRRYRPVLAKATEFDPKARYSSVGSLRDAFEEAGRTKDASPQEEAVPLAQKPRSFRMLGIVWNTALAVFLIAMSFGSCLVIWSPAPEVAGMPFVARFISYTSIAPVALGALSYALADRRPLRRFAFCRKLSLLQETLVCLVIVVVSLVFGYTTWFLAMA